jgi:hypothetical protein
MTPKELRQKARLDIASARELVKACHFDNASYVVGYAAELALKARCCVLMGWADFPDNRAEAKRRLAKEVMTHDLDDLLKMAGHAYLKIATMTHIDWDRVFDWSEQLRYRRVGSVTAEHATAQVEETAKLCDELALCEIVEKLLAVEIEMSSRFGPFNLFALVDRATQSAGWEVVSAWWMGGSGMALGDEVHSRVKGALDDDPYSIIGQFGSLAPNDQAVQMYYLLAFGHHAHHPRFLAKGNVTHLGFVPDSFIITNQPIPNPQRSLAK